MSTPTITREADRSIIASLSQEIAVKNQTILGLKEQIEGYEKVIRDLENRLIRGNNTSIKESDTMMTPTQNHHLQILNTKMEKILELLPKPQIQNPPENAKPL